MVSSISSSSLKFVQLLFAVVTLCIAISEVSAADINKICSQTRNPPICFKILNSIPGAAGLDIDTLGKTTINNAIANTTGTLNLIKSLLSKATDPQLKKNLSSCTTFFGDTVRNLQKTQADFAVRHYFLASLDAADALSNVDHCIGAIGSSVPSLSANIQNAESFSSTILVITETNTTINNS